MDEDDRDAMRERVLFSLMLPAVRMAQRYGVPLKQLTSAAELAYFHQLRGSGLRLRDIAKRMNVGSRKGSELSRRIKDAFFAPERDSGLPRQLEHMLWAAPLSRARLHQTARASSEDIDVALQRLETEGRVTREEISRPNGTTSTMYSLPKQTSRLVGEAWIARIDGLNWLLRAIADTVESRFFGPPKEAFARVVTVHLGEEDRERLERVYQDVIWPLLAEMDRNAPEDDADAVDFVFAFGPHGPMHLMDNDDEDDE